VGQDNAGHPALFLGAAGGGVWRSTNFVNTDGTPNNNPTFTPLMDFAGLNAPGPGIDPQTGQGAGAIDIGAVAVGPDNPSTIFVGTGADDRRYGTGVFMSTRRDVVERENS
jgi:hypothetical protein